MESMAMFFFVTRENSSPDVSQTWIFFTLAPLNFSKALRELLWQPLLSVSIRQVALQQGGVRTCFFSSWNWWMLIVLISCDIMDNLLRIFFAQLDD